MWEENKMVDWPFYNVLVNLKKKKFGVYFVWYGDQLTRNELLLPRDWPATVGLSGKERELDLFGIIGGVARGVPYPGRTPCSVFNPKPDPRRDADPTVWAIFKFEQYDMFDLRRELCRSNVFCAENGDGRTK